MAYANLNEDFGGAIIPGDSELDNNSNVLFRSKMFTKFCTFGFVAIGSWDMTYIVVLKGVARVYDTEETYLSDPSGYVLEINITRQIFTSQIAEKNYSKEEGNPIIIHNCYIVKENGMWTPTKQLKMGTSDKSTLKRLINALSMARY